MSSPFEFHLAAAPDLGLQVLFFQLDEAISRPYSLQISLHPSAEPAFAELAGTRAHLVIAGDAGPRYVHGVIASAEQDHVQSTVLRLVLVPALRTLALGADSRIFQDLSSVDIAEKLLGEHGVALDTRLARNHPKREYCVQYRESTLAFLERILADDGIFYFFEHDGEGGSERLVLADQARAYGGAAADCRVYYRPETGHGIQDDQAAALRFWARRELAAARVGQSDYDFTHPTVKWSGSAEEPEANAKQPSSNERGARPTGERELYQHEPSKHHLGWLEDRAGVALAQAQRDAIRCEGTSTCPRLSAGQLFHLQGQASLDGDYVITEVRHEGHGEPHLADGRHRLLNSFRCISADVAYRPPLPERVLRQVVESARVVGPPNEELHTDEHGRVKVQFHWDRDGRYDEHVSCWMRVMEPWAGAGYGAQFIPRVGSEVLVTFVGGNVDQPIVLGGVYNATHKHPYPVPKKKTASGLRSNSFGGGGGYNEIRFEDAGGDEELVIHAQKSLVEEVGGDHAHGVASNYTSRVGADATVAVAGSFRQTTAGDVTLASAAKRMDSIASEYRVDVGGVHLMQVAGHERLQVGGDLAEKVAGSASRSIGGRYAMTLGGWHVSCGTPQANANASFFVHGAHAHGATGTITLNSEQAIELVCGETRVRLTPDGVSITSPKVTINGADQTTVVGKKGQLLLADDAELSAPNVNVLSSSGGVELSQDAHLFGAKVRLDHQGGAATKLAAAEDAADTKTLAVTVADAAGKPYAGCSYCVVVDGVRHTGATDGSGGVSLAIPASAEHATLTVWTGGDYPAGDRRVYDLTLGQLGDASSLDGARARLKNLGYAPGSGAELDDTTKNALERFQRDHDLEPTAELDGPTIAALSA